MGLILKFVLMFGMCIFALSAGPDVFSNPTESECPPLNLGGVDYILKVRGRDYGWKEHTHRANIALAVHKYKGSEDEMIKMELQLEEEIIKALLKNTTSFNENDLAMFIHSLIATKKNPWDFHGLNLVGDLLGRVESDLNGVHPFLVLALCNSHAVEQNHLDKIKKYLESNKKNPEDVANKAIALKAYACAASLPYAKSLGLNPLIPEFRTAVEDAQSWLVDIQESPEGKFGNVYTTSLVVQALTAYSATGWSAKRWYEDKALDYLKGQSKINVNLLQAYYIVLALNAREVKCLKDLYGGTIGLPTPVGPLIYTSYTIMDDQNLDVYFTVTMKIPQGWNFFQVMEKARDMSNNFKFSYVSDKNNKPSVYEVIGKPNDAEQNFFWTICRMTRSHDSRSSEYETHTSSPENIIVNDNEFFRLWFRSSSCPSS